MKATLNSLTNNFTLKIKAIKEVDKARREYHSFVSVRTLRDINSNYELLTTFLRLENNLIKARNNQDKINGKEINKWNF